MSNDDTAPEAPETCNSSATPSRRGLLVAGAGGAGGGAGPLLAGDVLAAGATATLARLKRGVVLSLDPQVGDFAKGDVLIEGKKILAVGRNLNAAAPVVDAAGMIVMPGFVHTHHHQ